MKLQNHAGMKEAFKASAKLLGFNVTDSESFVDMASYSTLQLTFEKLPGVEFCTSKMSIQNYLKRLLKYLSLFPILFAVSLDFLHVLQSKPQTD